MTVGMCGYDKRVIRTLTLIFFGGMIAAGVLMGWT